MPPVDPLPPVVSVSFAAARSDPRSCDLVDRFSGFASSPCVVQGLPWSSLCRRKLLDRGALKPDFNAIHQELVPILFSDTARVSY